MAYNHKQASERKFPVKFKGQVAHLNEKQIAQFLKKTLASDLAVQKLFKRFEIDIGRLEDLDIQVVDLEGRYAETDDRRMSLDYGLFSDGNFIENNYFVAVHEIVHWLSRLKEKEAYFNDPEEVLGFVAAIASELQRGVEHDVVWNKIYPRVEFHFNNEADARRFFELSILKAQDLLK